MNPLIEILFFALLSFYLFFRLWSVLGKKTGLDSRPSQDEEKPLPGAKIIPLPTRDRIELVQEQPKGASNDYTIDEKIRDDLDQLEKTNPEFDRDRFVRGATRAYSMIVEAFGNEDVDTLKSLLGPAVFRQFSQAIKDRQALGEKLEARVVNVSKIRLVDAKMTAKKATITVQFDSDQMLATKDGTGIIHDNPARLSTPIRDRWVFSRDFASGSRNWLVTGTKNLNEEIAS
jgi:predicted lipid-binding transport protein (Tim44 family)